MSTATEILEFWFGREGEASYGRSRKEWFSKNPEFDQEMRDRFLYTYQRAANGELDSWKSSANSCLALIILLDQFPRNMFRGQPEAFATDSKALETAQYGISQSYDKEMLPVQRWFFYLPFEHSENLGHQQQAVDLFSTLSDDSDSQSPIEYAHKHLAVIQRFGRFPHRNSILKRESTSEEIEFLKQPGSSF